MKKTIAFVLTAAMLTLLCACGKSTDAPADGPAVPAAVDELEYELALTAEILDLPAGMAYASAQCRVGNKVWLGGMTESGVAVIASVSLSDGAAGESVDLPEGCDYVYAMCRVDGGFAVLAGSGSGVLWLLRFGETALISRTELEQRYDSTFFSMLELDGSFYLLWQDALVRLDSGGAELARFECGDANVVMLSMCELDGEIVLLANSYDFHDFNNFGSRLFTLHAQTLEASGETKIPDKILSGLGVVDGALVADTGSEVCALDGEFQLGDALFEWTELFVSGEYQQIEQIDGGYLFFVPGQEQVCFARMREVKARKTVVIASDGSYGDVQTLASDFNRSQDEYYAQVIFYTDDEFLRLQTEIGAGKWPDLFALLRIGTLSEMRDELTLDNLYDYLDADAELSRDDLMAPVLGAMEEQGALYWVPWRFWIETLIAPEALIPEPGISLEETLSIARENGLAPIQQWVTREELLRTYSSTAIQQFVDWDRGTCSFDSEEFIHILELCGEMFASEDVTADNGNLYTGPRDPYLLEKTFLTGCNNIAMLSAVFGEKYCCAGFPEASGNGSLFYIPLKFAITAGAQEKDGAWAFIKFVLSEEQQSIEIAGSNNGLSMNAAVFERGLETLLRDGFVSWVGEGERIDFTDDDARQFRELVYGVELVEGADATLEKIISDCAAAYFAGEKSAEDAARDIQGRASIYVSERG